MAHSKPEQEEPVSFEQALAELERIVHALEEGQLGLTEALAQYEAGVKLLKQCHALLATAERRIELLSGVDAEGRPVVEPFDEGAGLSLEEKSQARSRRRSRPAADPGAKRPSPSDPEMDSPGGLF